MKKPFRRKPGDTMLVVRIPPKTKNALRMIAEDKHENMSNFVRDLVTAYVDVYKDETPEFAKKVAS